MQQMAESSDRVQLTAAMKHLIVTGNVLIFAGKKTLKVYPSTVTSSNATETATSSRSSPANSWTAACCPLSSKAKAALLTGTNTNAVGEDGPKFGVAQGKGGRNDAEVYTICKLVDGQHKWHQECDGKEIKGTRSSSPLKHSPWMPSASTLLTVRAMAVVGWRSSSATSPASTP